MEQYLNKGIKEVIDQYPKVGEFLNTFDIGCTACSVGTCLVKDVVEIHDLSKDQKAEVLAGMESIISGKPVEIRAIETKKQTKKNGPQDYSTPMQRLVDEHVNILKLVNSLPEKADKIDLRQAIFFIRNYADKFHHAKEEDILFKYFDPNATIIKVMLKDHVVGRELVRKMEEALDANDKASAVEAALAYGALLKEHIKKEDEILYPWMDRELSGKQIGQLFDQFCKTDEKFDKNVLNTCLDFIKGGK